MNDIVILTPSYNRATTLPKLYESLKKQNVNNIDWVIVNDGSTDETENVVNSFIRENVINITYIYQPNGGKARALNKGFLKCEYASVIMVVDSDDYLLSTAINTLSEYMELYGDNSDIGAFFFHYNTPDGKLLKPNGVAIDVDKVMTRYQYNNKYKLNDGCICYLARVFKKYRYPEFNNEKYVGPTVIQMEMSKEYNIVFSPKVIGVAEYLDGGLSKSGRKLRLNNPMGMIYYAKLMMSPESRKINQIKYAISIWPYAKLANKTFLSILKMVNRPVLLTITYIPGILLYLRWKKFQKNTWVKILLRKKVTK